jgi:Lrp/AsnC family leucine-responsive transcriptional regulator
MAVVDDIDRRLVRTTVEIDPAELARSVVALVLIETEGWITDDISAAVRRDPRVEDLHTVAGEATFIAKLRVADPAELQRMLRAFHEIKGVRRTRTMMVLDTHEDRSPTISLHGRSG